MSQPLYGIGVSQDRVAFGMKNGPTPDLQLMLSVDGDGPGDYILKFDTEDGSSTIMYAWDVVSQTWLKDKDYTELKSKPNNADYLGDGVYVDYDGFHVKLMTGDHRCPDNTIFLEDSVLQALMRYLKRIGMTV